MRSKLILGTVQMGLPYGINNKEGKIPLDECFAILEHAHAAGIRYLDSAEAYGDAHQTIGQYHQQIKHAPFEIITKIPKSSSDPIEGRVINYLNDLNVNSIWGLMFHSFQSYKDYKHILEDLIRLKSEGLIKHIGVSVYTNEEFAQVMEDEYVEIIQFPYNLLDNFSLRGSLMKKAKAKGKILHTRSAFLQGLFFMDRACASPVLQKLRDELKELDKIVSDSGTNIGALALNYCLALPEVDNVLIGVDTASQLNSNLAWLNSPLNPEVVAHINNIRVENQDLLNPSLWK
jgi:aryl-alcohol dehydrogenase-like predicted oxidoreductase